MTIERRRKVYTDNGPDYHCPVCEKDIIGEIGHICGCDEEEEEE